MMNLLLLLVSLSATVCSEDVKLPQGDKISVEILQMLQSSHEIAMNHAAREDLFLSLPLVPPDQTNSVNVANETATVSSNPDFKNPTVNSTKQTNFKHEKRSPTCKTIMYYEGQDPCEGREKEPGFVECYKPCKFTRDWFVDNAKTKPWIDGCLFYTAGLSNRANAFANEHNYNSRNKLITIWQIWDESLFAWNVNIDNPMRCIVQDNLPGGGRNSIRQGYFERMSDSMAYMCGGNAVVMDRNIRRGRTGKVKQAGIWQRQEFPRLKMDASGKWQGRVVNRIDAIGENDKNVPDTMVWWKNWWYRNGPDWPNEATKPLRKRSIQMDINDTQAVDLNNVRGLVKRDFDTSIFDEGGRLEIDW